MNFSWRSSQDVFRKFASAFVVPTIQKRYFARMEFGKSVVGAPIPLFMIPEFEEIQTNSSLKFRLESAAVLIPHKSKEKRGGEDAVFARYCCCCCCCCCCCVAVAAAAAADDSVKMAGGWVLLTVLVAGSTVAWTVEFMRVI
jgi:hypothetical protein